MDSDRFVVETLPVSRVSEIKPFWEKLNDIHRRKSPHWADFYAVLTFEERMKQFFSKAAENGIRIDVARGVEGGPIVAYCFSSITARKEGEIDSLYVEPPYRRFKVADTLMRSALHWLDSRGAASVIVAVAAGNEGVLPFYEWYGFYPRRILLMRNREGHTLSAPPDPVHP